MRYDFAGNVYQSPANRGCIGANGYNRAANIGFEGLQQKMTQQHRIIPRRIGIELFKRQLFMTEVFQCPIGQLIPAALMVAGNNAVCLQITPCPGFFDQGIDVPALPDIGDDHRVGATSGQIKLIIVIHQAAVNCPSETVPVVTPAAKLNILPATLFAQFVPAPGIRCTGKRFDISVQLPATDITDFQFFTKLENLPVKKAAVHADNDGNILTILPADFNRHMPDHLPYRVAMVGVFVSTAENGIYNQAAPVHLQWLKALFLFVGRLNPLAAFSVIIVHDHGINTQLNERGLFYLQAPEEQGLHPVRGSHVFHIGLDTAGIAGISGELIKIRQMPAAAIDHETQHLLEKLENLDAFFVFPDRTEKPVQLGENLDSVQIGNKQGQSSPAGQTFPGDLNLTDLQFLFPEIFVIFAPKVFFLFGLGALVIALPGFNKNYSTLPKVEDSFCPKIAQVR